MRDSTKGLHQGVAIRVKGMGRAGRGTISREPEPGATHVYFRSYLKGGERLVAIEKVSIIRGPRMPKKGVPNES